MKAFFPLLLLTFCAQKNTVDQIISAHKDQIGDLNSIENITTSATCEGPEGTYTTRTSSSFTSDYLLFQQDYKYKNHPFYAVIYTKEEGYGLDSTLSRQGAISKPVIAVLKAHEFHELVMQVDERYFQLQLENDTSIFGVDCKQITAVDHLDYPVRLFFNDRTRLMEGFSQINPYKKGEIISVHFKNWQEIAGKTLFDQVIILQGNQAYQFNYNRIKINDPHFTISDL